MIKIREAKEADIATIRNIAYEVWPVAYADILSTEQMQYMLEKFYDPASLLHQMKTLNHHFIIAEENNFLTGFASFSHHTNNDKIVHLHKLYVRIINQKNNIGKLLIDRVLEIISAAGAEALQLNVNRHNKAIGFYEKMGFEIIRSEDIDIGNNYFMIDYVMEKRIPSPSS